MNQKEIRQNPNSSLYKETCEPAELETLKHFDWLVRECSNLQLALQSNQKLNQNQLKGIINKLFYLNNQQNKYLEDTVFKNNKSTKRLALIIGFLVSVNFDRQQICADILAGSYQQYLGIHHIKKPNDQSSKLHRDNQIDTKPNPNPYGGIAFYLGVNSNQERLIVCCGPLVDGNFRLVWLGQHPNAWWYLSNSK